MYSDGMKATTATHGREVCGECGLRSAAGEPNCAALRDALRARDFEDPVVYWQHHLLAVDTYCVQHSPYVELAKSLAADLCGLCVALEHANDPVLLKGIQLWLNTYRKLRKPSCPPSPAI